MPVLKEGCNNLLDKKVKFKLFTKQGNTETDTYISYINPEIGFTLKRVEDHKHIYCFNYSENGNPIKVREIVDLKERLHFERLFLFYIEQLKKGQLTECMFGDVTFCSEEQFKTLEVGG